MRKKYDLGEYIKYAICRYCIDVLATLSSIPFIHRIWKSPKMSFWSLILLFFNSNWVRKGCVICLEKGCVYVCLLTNHALKITMRKLPNGIQRIVIRLYKWFSNTFDNLLLIITMEVQMQFKMCPKKAYIFSPVYARKSEFKRDFSRFCGHNINHITFNEVAWALQTLREGVIMQNRLQVKMLILKPHAARKMELVKFDFLQQ